MLGLIGQINRTTIALVCLAIATAGFWRYRSSSRVQTGTGSRVSGAVHISWTAALASLVIGLALWASLVHLLAGLALPVEPISDAPIYHLPFAVEWWRSGGLPSFRPIRRRSRIYFPANGDLWLTWLMATGGGPLVKAGQWPFLVWGSRAVRPRPSDARTVAGGHRARTGLWVGLPIIISQSNIANIDLHLDGVLLHRRELPARLDREGGCHDGRSMWCFRCRADRDRRQTGWRCVRAAAAVLAVVVAVARAATAATIAVAGLRCCSHVDSGTRATCG